MYFSLADGFVTVNKMKALISVLTRLIFVWKIWQLRFRVLEQVLSCKLLLRTKLIFVYKTFLRDHSEKGKQNKKPAWLSGYQYLSKVNVVLEALSRARMCRTQ